MQERRIMARSEVFLSVLARSEVFLSVLARSEVFLSVLAISEVFLRMCGRINAYDEINNQLDATITVY